MNTKLHGVLPVFQTPYREDETIDAETLSREIAWLYDCGADGIVMAMVVGSAAPRQRRAAQACRTGVQIRARSRRCHHQRRRREREGRRSNIPGTQNIRAPMALMAIPPVSVAVGEIELLRYYERIIRATSLPVIVQDASGYVGRPMSIAMQAQLMKEFGPSACCSSPKRRPSARSSMNCATDQRPGDEYLKAQAASRWLTVFAAGSSARCRARSDPRHRRPVARSEAGDEGRSINLHAPISSLVAMQNSLDAFLAIEKYLLVKQGVFKNTIVRGPVGYTMDEETRLEIDRLFERVMLAVGGSK